MTEEIILSPINYKLVQYNTLRDEGDNGFQKLFSGKGAIKLKPVTAAAHKTLSSLGYLLERLGISSAELARELHIDASLVSKWKSGARPLSRRSPYFHKVVQFFCAFKRENSGDLLLSALQEIAPLTPFSDKRQQARLLEKILEEDRAYLSERLKNGRAKSHVEVALYDKNQGRRDAMTELLDIAETMDKPGTLIFVEAEQFSWLLEDSEYCSEWCRRVYELLEKGFAATVALHFTLHKDVFSQFFVKCSPLLFHRNIEWYCHEFYDEDVYWFSFAILEHSMSIMGMSMAAHQCTSAVFTDSYSVQQHKNVASMVIRSCRKIFRNFSAIEVQDFLKLFERWTPVGDVIYSFLPVPAMICARKELLLEILQSNKVDDVVLTRCMELNAALRKMLANHIQSGNVTAFWEIFQIEEMDRRISEPFISCSLSLLGAEKIIVSRKQYAQALLDVITQMKSHPWFKVALVSEKTQLLPKLNCWCMRSCWTVQMDEQGLRFCDEATFSSAASAALEISLRKIPAEYKDKNSVIAMLTKMIHRLECDLPVKHL